MGDLRSFLPNVIIIHHNQLFSREAKSVECLTIRVHLASERPNPDSAPYLAAIVWQKHIRSKNPIQLNKKATEKQNNNIRKYVNKILTKMLKEIVNKCRVSNNYCRWRRTLHKYIYTHMYSVRGDISSSFSCTPF